ncbi:MAG: LacI family DNA-binding transcriptional regulator [Actinomycetota bacterium]|nr:LacI family DNA-binding transcriptional regulator [Actinomycetota bacterium]
MGPNLSQGVGSGRREARSRGARKLTIQDVAALAGVHPSTASRALDASLPGRIAEPTARRVRAAAEELGYVPDLLARSLRTRRSGLVGVVIPDLTNPVLAPIVQGVEEKLRSAGFGCLLADTDNDPTREKAAIEELQARRCEGLVVATARRRSKAVEQLAQSGPPTVLVTRGLDSGGLPLVAADDAQGVAAAVRHLVALGHRHLAHLTGPRDLSTTVRRARAVRESAKALSRPAIDVVVRHGAGFTIADGRRLARALLSENPGVTAIVAGNDMIALGCLDAMADAGLRCPTDVSLVGHNDMPFVDRLEPALTTVAIPQRALGVRAAEVLLGRLAGGSAVVEPLVLPTRLVVRGSTAPPPRSRRVAGNTSRSRLRSRD